ncbi:MFS transporter [Actinocorallia herbida]|uniref:MFS transporter n=1 Tax=Actinocorallia herbida TaxID=58109 RepID=A0A3N1D264_9ACTN|nr:MFS transporter [Actinocorallia herbida]ROO87624.1 MFS transporter [Actinocorallia herbida]
MPRGLITALVFAAFGIYLATLTPTIVTLAIRISTIAPENKTAGLGVAIGAGAVLSLVAMPLAGALSDRTRSRFGRRRPWLLGGTVVGLAGLTVIGLADSVLMVVTGWAIAQAGYSAGLAGFLALIPERVPGNRRAKVSGLIGFATAIAVLIGIAGASELIAHPLAMMAGPGVLALVTAAVLAAVVRRGEPPVSGTPAPLTGREVAGMFVVDPRRYPDFGWTWLSRLFVGLGMAGLTTYATYFLTDQVGFSLEDATARYATATAITTPLALVCFLVAGVISDKLGRRKPFLIAASLAVAAALALAAVTHTFALFLAVMALFTIGQSFFFTVDIALAADVIPDRGQAAKGMSVYQVACNAPNSLIGGVGGALLAVGGGGNYPLLFGTCVAIVLIGGLLVLRVRSVR